jgi:hypothetical protein
MLRGGMPAPVPEVGFDHTVAAKPPYRLQSSGFTNPGRPMPRPNVAPCPASAARLAEAAHANRRDHRPHRHPQSSPRSHRRIAAGPTASPPTGSSRSPPASSGRANRRILAVGCGRLAVCRRRRLIGPTATDPTHDRLRPTPRGNPRAGADATWFHVKRHPPTHFRLQTLRQSFVASPAADSGGLPSTTRDHALMVASAREGFDVRGERPVDQRVAATKPRHQAGTTKPGHDAVLAEQRQCSA